MTLGQCVLTVALLIFAVVLAFYIKSMRTHEEYEFYKNLKDPDGILCLTETENGKIKANFILCIGFNELIERNKVIFEVRLLPPDSQENQDT